MTDVSALKRQAAEFAVEFIEPGMVVGLGEGSTAAFAIEIIGQRIQSGRLQNILGIPCSSRVARRAEALAIPLTTLERHPIVDVTIDGADEVDPHFNLIKGGGGALLWEKIVAQATRREIIIVDHQKLVPQLGTNWAVPIEVIPFGFGSQAAYLEALGAQVNIRRTPDGEVFRTDQGNFILDCRFGPIPDPAGLAIQIKARAGIVEHGLFINMTNDLIVAGDNGVRHLRRMPS